jgi:hypothetical protein
MKTIARAALEASIALSIFAGSAGSVALVQACSMPIQQAKSILDAAQVTCALASVLSDEEAILKACSIEKTLAPVLHQLLAAKQAGAVGAGKCPSDAGTDH